MGETLALITVDIIMELFCIMPLMSSGLFCNCSAANSACSRSCAGIVGKLGFDFTTWPGKAAGLAIEDAMTMTAEKPERAIFERALFRASAPRRAVRGLLGVVALHLLGVS